MCSERIGAIRRAEGNEADCYTRFTGEGKMSNSTVNTHDSRAAGAGGWARFALVGLLIYLVFLVAAHVLRPDRSARSPR